MEKVYTLQRDALESVLPMHRYDPAQWKQLRIAGASGLWATVGSGGSSEWDRPITPIADACDALLGSAGVVAMAVCDKTKGTLSTLFLDGTRGQQRADLPGPCKITAVKPFGRAAYAIALGKTSEVLVIDAYDWSSDIHRFAMAEVGGEAPDRIITLIDGIHVVVVCTESNTTHTLNTETGAFVRSQSWSSRFVQGMCRLPGLTNDVIVWDSKSLKVLDPYSMAVKADWGVPADRGQIIPLSDGRILSAHGNGLQCFDSATGHQLLGYDPGLGEEPLIKDGYFFATDMFELEPGTIVLNGSTQGVRVLLLDDATMTFRKVAHYMQIGVFGNPQNVIGGIRAVVRQAFPDDDEETPTAPNEKNAAAAASAQPPTTQ